MPTPTQTHPYRQMLSHAHILCDHVPVRSHAIEGLFEGLEWEHSGDGVEVLAVVVEGRDEGVDLLLRPLDLGLADDGGP